MNDRDVDEIIIPELAAMRMEITFALRKMFPANARIQTFCFQLDNGMGIDGALQEAMIVPANEKIAPDIMGISVHEFTVPSLNRLDLIRRIEAKRSAAKRATQ